MLLILAGSCNLKNNNQTGKSSTDSSKVQSKSVDSTHVSVITEKYSNGVTKSEVSAKGNKREGITKNYHEDGSLMSEINYVNNMKDGISRDFYPKGKKRMEIMYKKGIMEGDANWYYETGEVYRVTPYVKGKAEGVQKEYYKDKRIKAEIPHKSGVAVPGLKEYDLKGTIISQPTLITRKEDNVLKMNMSNHTSKVKYYEGEIKDWSNFPQILKPVSTDIDGNGAINYSALRAKGVRSLTISAITTTEMGNQLVLQKKVDL
jgi:antitoxin component YwqK of YwqJK toxin-antitoxin module